MAIAKYSGVMALLLLTACGVGDSSESAPVAKDLPTSQSGNLVRLGNATRASGDMNSAEKLYKEAIAQSKGSPAPYLALANLYQSGGQPLKAVEVLKDGAENLKNDPQIPLSLANLLISSGSSLEALKYARQSIALDSDNPRAFNTQGVALDNAGRYDEAQASYEKGVSVGGENTDYIKNNLALSYIMSDDYGKAITLLKPIAESKTSTQTVRQNLALAYGLKGDESTARQWMLKDMSEDKATENLAFYKHYSKERLISNRAAPTETASDTAVESVEVSDLDIPKDLLARSDHAAAKPIAAKADKKSEATVEASVSMVPLFKPNRIAAAEVPESQEIAEGAAKETHVKEIVVSAEADKAVQKELKEFSAKAVFKPKHTAEIAKANTKAASKKDEFAYEPKLKPLAEVEPSAGPEQVASSQPELSTAWSTPLPRPHFKPRLD